MYLFMYANFVKWDFIISARHSHRKLVKNEKCMYLSCAKWEKDDNNESSHENNLEDKFVFLKGAIASLSHS